MSDGLALDRKSIPRIFIFFVFNSSTGRSLKSRKKFSNFPLRWHNHSFSEIMIYIHRNFCKFNNTDTSFENWWFLVINRIWKNSPTIRTWPNSIRNESRSVGSFRTLTYTLLLPGPDRWTGESTRKNIIAMKLQLHTTQIILTPPSA